MGTISPEGVILAAVKVVRTDDDQRMTIRSRAGEPGVAPISRYRHVRDKDNVLDERVRRLLSPAWRPSVPGGSWYEPLRTYTIGFAALEISRARRIPDNTDASNLARQLAAYTTAGQFTDGLRYLAEGTGVRAGTGLAPGS